MTIVPTLRQRRMAAGLTQVMLARRMGVDPARLCRIEQGRSKPSIGTLRLMALELDCSIEDLLSSMDEILMAQDEDRRTVRR